VSVGLGIAVCVGRSDFSLVGGKRKESQEDEVGEVVIVGPETGIMTKPNVGVASANGDSVAGNTICVGTNSETI
jgi:hypothetical protein